MGKITYYYNGKRVDRKKDIPKGAKLMWTEIKHNEYYGDPEFAKEQEKASYDYLNKMREMREESEKYHG